MPSTVYLGPYYGGALSPEIESVRCLGYMNRSIMLTTPGGAIIVSYSEVLISYFSSTAISIPELTPF